MAFVPCWGTFALLAFAAFAGVVEDLEGTGFAELLLDVADHTHAHLLVGLDGGGDVGAVGLDALVALEFDEGDDVADLGDLVVELDTGFGTVFLLLVGQGHTHIDIAHEAFLLELGDLGALRRDDLHIE